MLTKALKEEIQKAYSQLLDNKQLKARYGQKQMIAEIARTLGAIEVDSDDHRINDAGICAIEAGTGTGKTVAYTLAVLPIAKALGKKVVISTATVALQEQIIYRDLPDITKHSGLDFKFALAKGRGRYLCLSKLDILLNDQAQHDFLDVVNINESPEVTGEATAIYEQMAKGLLTSSWDGDKDNWPEELSLEQWQPLTSDRNQCTGRRCQHVAQCSFMKARDNLSSVDCVVANHDLVMADLALGGGAILPDPEDTIYIFDEAHHLSDIALRHFSGHLRLHAALSWTDQTIKSIQECARSYATFIRLLNQLDYVPPLLLELKQLYAEVKPCVESNCEELIETLGDNINLPHKRFEHGVVPEELRLLAAECAKRLIKIVDELSKAHSMVDEALESNDSGLSLVQLEQLYALLGHLVSTAERHLALWQAYSKDVADIPDSRWIQLVEASGLIEFELSSSPLLAAKTLEQYLFKQCFACILTSATLTALGTFDRLKMNTGLPEFANTQIVPSPFDYANNAQFIVPDMKSEATDHHSHSDEIAQRLPALVEGDSAVLVLFSSKRQLQDVFGQLSLPISEDVLLQSDMSKQQLIEEHIRKIDAGKRSIIFGLASFAEGVDLPNQYCTHVVIAKLPFSVPNDPLTLSLAEWFEDKGKNAFMEVSLPEASQRLVQACGRLIRTEHDKGKITLLDKRVLTKRYGARLLSALPPFQQVLH